MKNTKGRQTITIVGAGFSGLTTAYFLAQRGFHCKIYEKNLKPGGLISSVRSSYGIAENGALSLMATDHLLSLCKDLGVDLIAADPRHKKRFFFRNKIRQWPLNFFESVKVFSHFFLSTIASTFHLKPEKYETIFNWSERLAGRDMGNYLLFPALQGIYAGNPKEMSASLIFNKKKIRYKGLYAPIGGMQTLIDKLICKLDSLGVVINYNLAFENKDPSGPVIWCTGAHENPYMKDQVDVLPLATVTMYFLKNKNQPKGFGCLFPRNQGLKLDRKSVV